jgi:hypothetical protein
MSRTYRKNIRCFCCYGDNHKFYELRRRQRRHRINHEVRNLLSKYGPEGLDEMWKGADMTTEAQWMEPTDGHWSIDKEYLKRMDRKYNNDPNYDLRYHDRNYLHRLYDRYFKPKHRKHYRTYMNI